MNRLATACVAAAALCGCNPQPGHRTGVPTPSPTPQGVPPLSIRGQGASGVPVSILEQKGNRTLYRLLAASYVSHSEQNIAQAVFQKATVTFYDKDGTTMTARAPQAALDERTKQVSLSGGVHATTSSGASLDCRTLVYDRDSGMLTGTGGVRVTLVQGGNAEHFTGNRFTSNVRLTQMVLR